MLLGADPGGWAPLSLSPLGALVDLCPPYLAEKPGFVSGNELLCSHGPPSFHERPLGFWQVKWACLRPLPALFLGSLFGAPLIAPNLNHPLSLGRTPPRPGAPGCPAPSCQEAPSPLRGESLGAPLITPEPGTGQQPMGARLRPSRGAGRGDESRAGERSRVAVIWQEPPPESHRHRHGPVSGGGSGGGGRSLPVSPSAASGPAGSPGGGRTR